MDGLVLFLAQELGLTAGRRAVRAIRDPPEVRALRTVVKAALDAPELAALAAPDHRDGFLAALRNRLGDDPPDRPRYGRPEVSEATLRRLVGDWVAPLTHPVPPSDQSPLAGLGIDPEHLRELLYALVRAGIRADAAGGGPLQPLDTILRLERTSEQQDALVSLVRPVPPVPPPPAGVGAVDTFTGRSAELTELTARLIAPPPGVVPVLTIHGPPGIGKSALAAQVGRHPEVVAHYPDGVLLVDLLGWTDGMEPLGVGPVLAHLLSLAGVPVPDDGGVERLLPAWRGWLAGRRVLVVLDNARDEVQVRHLLPDQPGCAVVVTSRERLGHLAGAAVSGLGALAGADAAELLRRLAGPGRLDDEEATARILALCGGWPLALRLAAGIFRNEPDADAAEVAAALSSASATELDPMTARLRASYERLDDELRPAFRWLASWDGPALTPFAAALLLDRPEDDAVGLLRRLARAELLLPAGPSRWRPHDLVRSFADGLNGDDPWDEHYRTFHRLLDGYLAEVEEQGQAWDRLADEDENVAIAARGAVVGALVVLSDPPDEAARAERNARLAHRLGLDDASALTEDAVRLHTAGVRLAEEGSRLLGLIGHTSAALNCAALLNYAVPDGADRFGRLLERDVVYPQFTALLRRQIAELREAGDERSAGRMLLALAATQADRGDSEAAASSLRAGLRSVRVAGDRWAEARGLAALARLEADRGAADLAREHLTRSLARYEELGPSYVDPVTGNPLDPADVDDVRERLRALDDD
ncbi:NB-ARC domain-containing protein [Jiangella muralis]|uniref:NB-ARC domain-containing protein n=1 Tax=Jiangella muralis TaxID=702383 RepID=UPI00069D1E39|nr:NB-ARC domain-containing protein [Jiangella muralis]